MHDWVNGVIWHQLCDATLWIQLLCNLATLQPLASNFIRGGGRSGGAAELSQRGVAPGYPLDPSMALVVVKQQTTQNTSKQNYPG